MSSFHSLNAYYRAVPFVVVWIYGFLTAQRISAPSPNVVQRSAVFIMTFGVVWN